MSRKIESKEKELPWYVAMVLGGMAGMVATTAVHPLDLIKVRLQLLSRYCTTREMARLIIRCRGHKAFYVGLSAGLMRQTTYTTTRLGVYHALYNIYRSIVFLLVSKVTRAPGGIGDRVGNALAMLLVLQASIGYGLTIREDKKNPAIYEKIAIGITAGLAGALAGNPSEVILVRLMADGPLEPCIDCSCPRRYRGTFQALQKICKEEGVRALWRGGTLTLGRSVLVSIGQLGSYSKVREIFHEKQLAHGLSLHVYTSLVSSFITAVVSLPIDLVKTRYQVRKSGIRHSQIFYDIYYRKGIWYFWKGFVPYYVRMAIHTIISLLVFDELYKIYYNENKND